MALKVIIQVIPEQSGHHPVYHTLNDGVIVDSTGSLLLIASRDKMTNVADEFRIYAPGTWKEVNASAVSDE